MEQDKNDMRRGPKGDSLEQQNAKGETRPSRQIITLFPDVVSRPDPDVIAAPKGMSPAARKIWAVKVERYRQRGQKVQGEEDGLRIYCELEARIHRQMRTTDGAPIGLINAHRAWAGEFFDSPASKNVRPQRGSGSGNKFDANVRRPAAG